MKVRTVRMWEPVSGLEHCMEAFRCHGGYYVLMVDGAFYADCESMGQVEEEMIDVADWFGWTAVRPAA